MWLFSESPQSNIFWVSDSLSWHSIKLPKVAYFIVTSLMTKLSSWSPLQGDLRVWETPNSQNLLENIVVRRGWSSRKSFMGKILRKTKYQIIFCKMPLRIQQRGGYRWGVTIWRSLFREIRSLLICLTWHIDNTYIYIPSSRYWFILYSIALVRLRSLKTKMFKLRFISLHTNYSSLGINR